MSHKRRAQIISEARALCSSPIHIMILKEAKLINDEKLIIDHLRRECLILKKAGKSQEVINEGVVEFLSKFAGDSLDAALDKLKKYLTDGLMTMIGLDPNQPGGWGILGCAISNTLEEMPISMFKKILGSGIDVITGQFDNVQKSWVGMCEELADVIMKGVTECATEKIQKSEMTLSFYKALVGNSTIDKASKSFLWGVADEYLQNYINDTETMTDLRNYVASGLCKLNLEEVLTDVSSELGSLTDTFLDALGLGDVGGLVPAGA
jgi:hypothetical protein